MEHFEGFVKKLSQLLQAELPGPEAQYLMAPELRRERADMAAKRPGAREAAVLTLFYPLNDEPHLALTLRNEYPGVHSGQVSLPGGRKEPGDVTLLDAALRETEEEIGVPAHTVQVLGQLTELYIPASHFHVFPFIGMVEERPQFIPDPTEVAKIIEVSVWELGRDEIIKEKEISIGGQKIIRTPYFDVDGHIVWGATAMILSELLELVKRM